MKESRDGSPSAQEARIQPPRAFPRDLDLPGQFGGTIRQPLPYLGQNGYGRSRGRKVESRIEPRPAERLAAFPPSQTSTHDDPRQGHRLMTTVLDSRAGQQPLISPPDLRGAERSTAASMNSTPVSARNALGCPWLIFLCAGGWIHPPVGTIWSLTLLSFLPHVCSGSAEAVPWAGETTSGRSTRPSPRGLPRRLRVFPFPSQAPQAPEMDPQKRSVQDGLLLSIASPLGGLRTQRLHQK